MSFKVGDRIIITKDNLGLRPDVLYEYWKGKHGTVAETNTNIPSCVRVSFDLHTAHGYYLPLSIPLEALVPEKQCP
jgi:hypothetical protein